jgi:pSer/pThr/pTyr-binding forkhead associated (FHA) protein
MAGSHENDSHLTNDEAGDVVDPDTQPGGGQPMQADAEVDGHPGRVTELDAPGPTHTLDDVTDETLDDVADETLDDVADETLDGVADETLDDVTDDTTVDSEVAREVRERYGDEPAEPSADSARAAPIEGSIDDLGPAFPEDPEDWAASGPDPTARVAVARVGRESEGNRSGGTQTNARPGLETPYEVQREAPRDEPEEDGWAGFDQSGVGWTLTGESQVSKPAGPHPPARSKVEGEYSRQNTDVYELGSARSQSQAQQGGRLVCVAGLDSGREYAVDQREMTIGRAPGCSVILTDASVSREHGRLLRDGDAYIVVDQRSANGTFLNGQRIDRGRLRSGDEVGFGNTRFRFLEIGDVFKPVDASGAPILPGAKLGPWQRLRANPNFKAMVVSIGMLVVAIAVTVTILGVRYARSGSGKRSERIFEYYLSGVDAFKRRQWADAKTQFAIVVGLDPTHEKGQAYLREISKEMSYEQQLAAARASREAGDLAQAYAQASSITDSVYTHEAKELVRGIDAELDARVALARTKLQAGDANAALEELRAVEAVRPGRPEVLALRDRATQVVEGGAGPGTRSSPEPLEPSSASRLAPRPAPKRQPPTGTARSGGSGPVRRATDLFAGGDVEGALDALEGAGDSNEVKVLRAKLEKFAEVYNSALEEHRAKRAKSAIKQLKKAKAFEAKITGGGSKVTGEIDKRLADMYYVQGISAYLEGRLPEAYRSFKTALSHKADHGPAARKLDDLAVKAKEAFEAGYRAKDTEPEEAREGPERRIVAWGDSDFASNTFFAMQGNGVLFLNSVNWLARRGELVSLPPRDQVPRTAVVHRPVARLIFVVCVMLFPLLVLGGGLALWGFRRRL